MDSSLWKRICERYQLGQDLLYLDVMIQSDFSTAATVDELVVSPILESGKVEEFLGKRCYHIFISYVELWKKMVAIWNKLSAIGKNASSETDTNKDMEAFGLLEKEVKDLLIEACHAISGIVLPLLEGESFADETNASFKNSSMLSAYDVGETQMIRHLIKKTANCLAYAMHPVRLMKQIDDDANVSENDIKLPVYLMSGLITPKMRPTAEQIRDASAELKTAATEVNEYFTMMFDILCSSGTDSNAVLDDVHFDVDLSDESTSLTPENDRGSKVYKSRVPTAVSPSSSADSPGCSDRCVIV